MNQSDNFNAIFQHVVIDYHVIDDVDAVSSNPYPEHSLEALLYQKCWIDAVQWHLEDIIRDPHIEPSEALAIKRRIDSSNQVRTDMVEMIDSYFLQLYQNVQVLPSATINTESPAWAIDRLSILHLKIYHMENEANRMDADDTHHLLCTKKLEVLQEQLTDLSTAIDQLLEDIQLGQKYMKVYKQMKMYNDPMLNPVLYANKNK